MSTIDLRKLANVSDNLRDVLELHTEYVSAHILGRQSGMSAEKLAAFTDHERAAVDAAINQFSHSLLELVLSGRAPTN